MTEAEKRERRALERKLSEMEEELKVSIDLFLSPLSLLSLVSSLFALSLLLLLDFLSLPSLHTSLP